MQKKNFYSKYMWYALVGIVILSGILFLYITSLINQPALVSTAYGQQSIVFQDQTINVLVAETDEQRFKGLSGRSELPVDFTGMLFVFDQPGLHGIWMKDMLISIDIFWLDENFNIVDQKLNVSPDTFPETLTPSAPAKYVLEIPNL